ncbi:unnamed protein product [Cuscuta campestris]|uniref:Replication factor A C-terminal domain-containing protein n=1 Tax=Cuscuta campestris TaxID=132261 RepID=A0A484NFP3_9ASTE|nr:unnamed protein product [Cuscuta campestris]
MLLSFCRPRRYMGTVTVSTAFHVTKMIFDGNSPEVEDFRARYKVSVRVYDHIGHASFILWDRECKEVLGASVFVLMEIMLEADVGSPSWTGPRTFGVRSLVTDPQILSKYEHLVVIQDEEADRESEGLWASLEDLSQKVHEVIGSNNPSSSQSVNTKQRRISDLDESESLKRELFDEILTTASKKMKKETTRD